MDTRIVYIHGDGVTDWQWGWVGLLKEALDDHGLPNFFETFPDSIRARAKYWLPFLEDHIKAGPNDVLLGWSCGTLAAMRYAESHQVHGLILVSPFYQSDHELVLNSGFLEGPWDWRAIRTNTSTIAIFQSDNDPHVGVDQFSFLGDQLNAQVFECHGAGHFNEQETFPELTRYIIDTYGAR